MTEQLHSSNLREQDFHFLSTGLPLQKIQQKIWTGRETPKASGGAGNGRTATRKYCARLAFSSRATTQSSSVIITLKHAFKFCLLDRADQGLRAQNATIWLKIFTSFNFLAIRPQQKTTKNMNGAGNSKGQWGRRKWPRILLTFNLNFFLSTIMRIATSASYVMLVWLSHHLPGRRRARSLSRSYMLLSFASSIALTKAFERKRQLSDWRYLLLFISWPSDPAKKQYKKIRRGRETSTSESSKGTLR